MRARLAEQGSRLVYVRHEHCAVAAAMTCARKNSEMGVATVTCGPGVTQLITALPAAVRAHLPLVVFAGEAPLKCGSYNQGIDQAPLITATGAAFHGLHMPERMPIAVRGLFHDDRYCIGITGSFSTEVGLEYVAQADLVIAVGCSLAYHAGGGGQLYPKAKTLQIDIDPVTINQGQEVARHHLRADARLGVEALTAALPVRTTTWRGEAMAARPDKTVVLFDGDGSLMMHVQELETIKRHRMNILIVVINDGAY